MPPTNAKPKVDYFVIGAARSGTTSIYRALSVHPMIYQAEIKEPRFFNQNWNKGWDWYSSIFESAAPGQLCGDYSPSYSNADEANYAAERIARAYPECRIIYMVRNPIECAISNWRMSAEIAGKEVPFLQAIRDDWRPATLHRVQFFKQLQFYREHLSDEQILVVPLELIRSDSAAWLDRVQRHIGIPDDQIMPLAFFRANASERKPDRPGVPHIPLEARTEFLDGIRDDTAALLDHLDLAPNFWDISPHSRAWTKGK